MIFVDRLDETSLKITFTYYQDYVRRISQIRSARFVKNEGDRPYWRVPLAALPQLEEIFHHADPEIDELYFNTPRWQLLGEPEPPPPAYLQEVPNYPISRLKTPPLVLEDFQVFGANFALHTMVKYGFCGILDDVGIGKSAQVAMSVNLMEDQGVLKPDEQVLYVTLSSVKWQFKRDTIDDFTDQTALVIKGDRKKRAKLYTQAANYKYIIVNYEQLLQDLDFNALSQLNFQVVWFDEPHKRLLDHKGKIHAAAKALVANIPYMGITTATPVVNEMEDLWSLLDIKDLAEPLLGTHGKFVKKYRVYLFQRGRAIPVGYRGISYIRNLTEHFFLRRTANEVAIKRPKAITGNLYCEPTSLQEQLLSELVAAREQLLEKINRLHQLQLQGHQTLPAPLYGSPVGTPIGSVIVHLNDALQGLATVEQGIVDSPELLTLSESANIQKRWGTLVTDFDSPKLDLLEERIIEHIKANEKAIVFTQYKTMARLIWKRLAVHTKLAAIAGGMSDDKRDENLQRFKHDPDCMVLVLTSAGQEGLNLQVARYGYNFDNPWTDVAATQRTGRIQRRGSLYDEVYWYNLIMTDTIDERALRAQKRKADLATALVGVTEEQSHLLQLSAKSKSPAE